MWFRCAGTSLSKKRGASVFRIGNCVEPNIERTGVGRRTLAVSERLFRVGSPTFSRLSPIRFDAATVPVLLVLPHPQFWSYCFSHSPSSGPVDSLTPPVPVLLVLSHPQFRSYCLSHSPSSGPVDSPTSPVPVLLLLPHPQFRSC